MRMRLFMYLILLPCICVVFFSDNLYAGTLTQIKDYQLGIRKDGPRDMPVYAPGYGGSVQYADLKYRNVDCPVIMTATLEGGILVPGYDNMYYSGIPGVGFRYISQSNTNTQTGIRYAPNSFVANEIQGSGTQRITVGTYTFPITGFTEAGRPDVSILPRLKTTFTGSCVNTMSFYFDTTANIAYTPTTCSVVNPAIVVNMGSVPREALKSVGNTAGDTDFDISVDCASWAFGWSVNATFTDDSGKDMGNRTDILPLDAQSTASGVGFQIFYNDRPVSFGPDSTYAGTENQILLENLRGGDQGVRNYNFKVKYIATDVVAPGTTNSRVTFTMSYQ